MRPPRTRHVTPHATHQVQSAEPSAPPTPSFTRVVVGDLKSEVLAALADEDGALSVLRDLAHLYHYYIHGPKGNAFMWVLDGRGGVALNMRV